MAKVNQKFERQVKKILGPAVNYNLPPLSNFGRLPIQQTRPCPEYFGLQSSIFCSIVYQIDWSHRARKHNIFTVFAVVIVFPEAWLVAFFNAGFVPGTCVWERDIFRFFSEQQFQFQFVYLSPPVWSILAKNLCVVSLDRPSQLWHSRRIQASCRSGTVDYMKEMLTAQLPAEHFCLPLAEVVITHSSPNSLVTHLVAMFHLQRCLGMISG